MNERLGSAPKPIETTRLLIGEGTEEVLFFEAFLAHLGIEGIQVEAYQGKDGLAAYLKALNKRSGFGNVEKLGIVRDADDDPKGAALSVEDAISRAAFPEGLVAMRLILPGEGRTGALENLCLRTIAGRPIETCIEDYIACASAATGIVHDGTTRKAKARVRTWLASHTEPDLRLGHVAKKGLLDWACPAFGELAEFLRDLAEPRV